MRDRIRQGESSLPASLVARLGTKRLVLVTTHRRESFGAGIEHTCAAILALAQSMDDVVFALPVHPNPRVRDVVLKQLDRHPRIVLLEPQPYRALVELMDRATLILTDSGGVQEEAPTFGTPVLVLRTTTERPEGIEAGVAKLVGTDRDRIVAEALELLRNPEARARMSAAVSPYGDGFAAQRIVHALRDGRRPTTEQAEARVNGQAARGFDLPTVTSV
jgi:UDP-N-acetylglucosamine 2-epimerase